MKRADYAEYALYALCVRGDDHAVDCRVVAHPERGDWVSKRAWGFKVSKIPVATRAALESAMYLMRSLYNAALQERRDAYRTQRKSVTRYDQQKELTEVRAEHPEYAGFNVEMMRASTTTRVDLAFKAFFRRCKSGETPGYPRYKGRDRFRGLTFGPGGWRLDGAWLTLQGIGRLRVSLYRPVPRAVGLRLVERGGRWWVQFVVDVEDIVLPKTGKTVGVDVGLTTFATLSDGTEIANPRFARHADARLRALQAQVSRKRKGSNRRKKAKAILGAASARVANQRLDFMHQVSRRMVNAYDEIAALKRPVLVIT